MGDSDSNKYYQLALKFVDTEGVLKFTTWSELMTPSLI